MSSSNYRKDYDVVIVGARCAGAATAMRLAEAGYRVLVFDKSRLGADTVSTHALMRPAVLLLKHWGITDRLDAAATPRIEKTSFVYADETGTETISIDINQQQASQPEPPLRSWRRQVPQVLRR